MIIPTTEIYNFDEQTYLEANPEVETLIKNNELKDTLEHLQAGGQEEIGRGTRKFHQDFPPFDENRYLQTFKSVREAVENGVFASGFDHFCQFGYEEILRGKRLWSVLQEARTIQKVIVIIGIPRSGLTLTEALLGSHSQITPWFLPYATRKDQGIKPFTDSDSIQRAYAEAYNGDEIYTNTVAISSSTTDESIDFLTQSLENLEKNGIEVKIIWMMRNINHTYISRMEAAHRYWNGPEDNIKIESYRQFISFAQKSYDKIVALVKYYDHVIHSFSALLKEPNSIMHKIQDFVQISAEDSHDFYSQINLKRVAGDPGFLTYDTVLKLKDRERQQQWEEYDHFIQSLDASLQFFVQEYNLLTAKAKKEPLVHFFKIGHAEDKLSTSKNIDSIISVYNAPEDLKKVSKIAGAITEYDNGQIRGWCYFSEQFEPLILVNGRPCKIVKSNVSMPQVSQNNKLDRDDIGFIAEVTEGFMDATDISLYATFPNLCVKVASTNKFIVNNVSPRSLSVFNDLKQISSQKNAVAIVVWDVTHNPIGRAKVLYDIVKEKHPVIMIGFDFGFSKSEVWEPLVSSDIKLLSIKWDERELYSRIMKDLDISFDTVWICKPRLPSFVLADMVSTEETNFILDIDDNESEMSQDNTFLPKPYGLLGNHLAESIVEKIAAVSLCDNYKMFEQLRELASEKKKSDIFTVPLLPYTSQKNSEQYSPTLVLLWKQPDSTLYGRRVDQLARSYKRQYPDHRVVLIETMNADQEKYYKSQKDYYVDDSALILERLREKRITLELEGVEHIMLDDQIFNETDSFRSFLLSQKMLPQNTLFVLFPVIGYFEKFFNVIAGYRYIADIVDNQLGWKQKHPEKLIQQYKIMCKNAENVVFNSGNNRDFFIDHGLLEEREKSLEISNWYELPETAKGEELSVVEKNPKKIFYSGNMNDRIDWELIENLLYALPEGITLYLIGNACSARDKVEGIISRHDNCQFLGPIDERMLIPFIEDALFAIIPHTVESTSHYMNPLKIYMYASLGIECVSTDVPGLEGKLDHLAVCDDQVSFIAECLNSIYRETHNNIPRKRKNLDVVYAESRDRYLALLSEILKENQ